MLLLVGTPSACLFNAMHNRIIGFSGISILVLTAAACGQGIRRAGMPAAAQAVLEAAIEDIDAGRYERLYQEASDEWRRDATLEQSKATFRTLHEKLGNVRTRAFDTAREEQ